MSVGRVLLALVLVSMASGCTMWDGLGEPGMSGPGAAYESYLAGSTDRIVVEIDHAPGTSFDSDTPAEEEFIAELERITTKEVTVRYEQDLESKGEEYAYGVGELREMHAEHMDHEPDEETEVIHALFVDGKFDEGVAGLAFAERSFALFKGEIREITCENDAPVCNQPCPEDDPLCTAQASPAIREWKLTRSVAIHEAGHLFGLVNSPLPMVEDHEDPEHLGHSSNESSVMYWRVESGAIEAQDYLEGGEVPDEFGEHDIQDARAVQADA